MDKNTALKIIFTCAEIYNTNLINKHYLLIYLNNDNYENIEIIFKRSNFLHLTGIELKDKNISANSFFNKCLKKRLSIHDFNFKKDGTTQLKLDILPQLMNININYKMIGDYNESRLKLFSDKITGNKKSCLGLIKDGNYYYPNTALKEDTRIVIKNMLSVAAIFSKDRLNTLYDNLIYVANNINIKEDLTTEILNKLDTKKFEINIAQDEAAVTVETP